MRKITFLTLVMILGMSSVSFGKSYLCISEIEKFITFSERKKKWIELKTPSSLEHNKFILKTYKNDKGIESFTEFGSKHDYCSGKGKLTSESFVKLKKGISHIYFCDVSFLIGRTNLVFVSDRLRFKLGNMTKGVMDRLQYGKCSEI